MLLLMDICFAKYWLNVSAFSLSSEIKQLLYFSVGGGLLCHKWHLKLIYSKDQNFLGLRFSFDKVLTSFSSYRRFASRFSLLTSRLATIWSSLSWPRLVFWNFLKHRLRLTEIETSIMYVTKVNVLMKY
jgi:hypothetical protein